MDTNGHTHFVGQFLPWHRMFLKVRCNENDVRLVADTSNVHSHLKALSKSIVATREAFRTGIGHWVGDKRRELLDISNSS